MADFTRSGLTLRRALYDGWGKKSCKKDIEVVLDEQGSAENAITAKALGFQSITESTAFVKSDNSQVVQACPSFSGDKLLLLRPAEEGEDPNVLYPEDFTGTFRGVVTGSI